MKNWIYCLTLGIVVYNIVNSRISCISHFYTKPSTRVCLSLHPTFPFYPPPHPFRKVKLFIKDLFSVPVDLRVFVLPLLCFSISHWSEGSFCVCPSLFTYFIHQDTIQMYSQRGKLMHINLRHFLNSSC